MSPEPPRAHSDAAPQGHFALTWACLENCHLATPGLPRSLQMRIEGDDIMWWARDTGGVDQRSTAELVAGCWRVEGDVAACQPAFYVCPDGDGVVAELSWAYPRLELRQRWVMTGDRLD